MPQIIQSSSEPYTNGAVIDMPNNTDPQPSCSEIARQIITDLDRTAFLSKADNWREQITEALQAKQKTIEEQTIEIRHLRHDIDAYRGALGYSVPGDHDGRLWGKNEAPVCGMCGPKNNAIESLRAEVERLREVKIISIKDSSGGTYEHTAEVVSLKSQLSRLKEILKGRDEALRFAEEYFDQRADAQYFPNSPAPVPNTEMAHLVLIREALSKTWEAKV